MHLQTFLRPIPCPPLGPFLCLLLFLFTIPMLIPLATSYPIPLSYLSPMSPPIPMPLPMSNPVPSLCPLLCHLCPYSPTYVPSYTPRSLPVSSVSSQCSILYPLMPTPYILPYPLYPSYLHAPSYVPLCTLPVPSPMPPMSLFSPFCTLPCPLLCQMPPPLAPLYVFSYAPCAPSYVSQCVLEPLVLLADLFVPSPGYKVPPDLATVPHPLVYTFCSSRCPQHQFECSE